MTLRERQVEALDNALKALRERRQITLSNDIASAIMFVDEAIKLLKEEYEGTKKP